MEPNCSQPFSQLVTGLSFCFVCAFPSLLPNPTRNIESLDSLTNITQTVKTSFWALRFQAASFKHQIHSKAGVPFGKHIVSGVWNPFFWANHTKALGWQKSHSREQDLCAEDTTVFTAELNQIEKELSSAVPAIINLFQISFPSFNQTSSQAIMP